MLAYLQVNNTAWDAFLTVSDEALQETDPEVARLRRNGQLVTGEGASYWKELAGFINVNMIGSEAQLDAVKDYFAPAEVNMYFKWGFDGKVNFPTEYTGQYDDILTLMKDRITYDEDGNPTGSTPASFEVPNWANGWAGQKQNRFARNHSREFSGEFD